MRFKNSKSVIRSWLLQESSSSAATGDLFENLADLKAFKAAVSSCERVDTQLPQHWP